MRLRIPSIINEKKGCIVTDAYDVLRFAIRGHNAVRTRLLRAAESMCKGDLPRTPLEPLMEEFDLAHQRLMGSLGLVAKRGPAPAPLIPQPKPKLR